MKRRDLFIGLGLRAALRRVVGQIALNVDVPPAFLDWALCRDSLGGDAAQSRGKPAPTIV